MTDTERNTKNNFDVELREKDTHSRMKKQKKKRLKNLLANQYIIFGIDRSWKVQTFTSEVS